MSQYSNRSVVMIGLIIFFFIFTLTQIPIAKASVSWMDDFNDESLDDWIVTRGVFSAEKQTLWAYGSESRISNRAYHICNITAGKWRFDILVRHEWLWDYHPPSIRFMVSSLNDLDWQGYVVDFYTIYRSTGDVFAVYLRKHTTTWAYISHYEFDRPSSGWQDVEIIRESNGHIKILLNSTEIIDAIDTSINESKYFAFDTEDCVQTVFDPATHTDSFVRAKESPMLDNIIVYETPGTTALIRSMILIITCATAGIITILYCRDELSQRR
ncbi:MAG: hypothetical protein JW779_03785 [Candidatus Thorarchaeota archaeon]|nr:hypothetical protein [Candidatus Thorarchaeota archaeon]